MVSKKISELTVDEMKQLVSILRREIALKAPKKVPKPKSPRFSPRR